MTNGDQVGGTPCILDSAWRPSVVGVDTMMDSVISVGVDTMMDSVISVGVWTR